MRSDQKPNVTCVGCAVKTSSRFCLQRDFGSKSQTECQARSNYIMDFLWSETVLLQHLEAVISLKSAQGNQSAAFTPRLINIANLMMLPIREVKDGDLSTLVHAPTAQQADAHLSAMLICDKRTAKMRATIFTSSIDVLTGKMRKVRTQRDVVRHRGKGLPLHNINNVLQSLRSVLLSILLRALR
eukprot:749722-Hanusia_phi.AAC.3